MANQIGAHYLLEGLVELGMEYLFANLGTDHVSIVEELARWRKEGRADLQVVICPHENVAVHMAGGYAAVTGRGQPVLVHVDVGTANAGTLCTTCSGRGCRYFSSQAVRRTRCAASCPLRATTTCSSCRTRTTSRAWRGRT